MWFTATLWPGPAFFIGLTACFWLLLTPSVEQVRSLSAGWITLLFVRNLIVLVLFVGIVHRRWYVLRVQGSEYKYDTRWPAVGDSTFLFKDQVWDNVFLSVFSAVPIWTAYEAMTLWLHANGYVETVSWRDHFFYCVILLVVTPIWGEVHFYITHRMLHWRPLYRSVHYVHHKNTNVGPWSGIAMHPVEHVIFFSGVALFWLIPSHPMHSIFYLLSSALWPSLGHFGFDRLRIGKKFVNIDHYIHYLHHRYVMVNYGTAGGLLPIDKWLNTFHDGSEEAMEAMKARVRERMRRSRGGE